MHLLQAALFLILTKFVIGPIKATLPNLLLSDNPIITAPGAMNLDGIIGGADIAVITMPHI
jgi:hypothetical protein